MKSYEINPALLFVHLMTIGLITGIFYGKTEKYKRLETDYGILQKENSYLKKSRRKILQQQRRFRFERHEMKNDYILEMAYLERKLYRQLKEHYWEKIGYSRSNNDLIHTGSIGLDAILNHKCEIASKDHIHINVHHKPLSHIKINHHDLNILLGNLLDNAIEAVRHLDDEERQISLNISANATALFLEADNKYTGLLQRDDNGNYLTQKTDAFLHGLGLLRVKYIAHKYGGNVVISTDKNHFNVKVLLYMPES